MVLIDQEQAAKQIRGNKEYVADCEWLKGYNKACEDNAQIVEQMKGVELSEEDIVRIKHALASSVIKMNHLANSTNHDLSMCTRYTEKATAYKEILNKFERIVPGGDAKVTMQSN